MVRSFPASVEVISGDATLNDASPPEDPSTSFMDWLPLIICVVLVGLSLVGWKLGVFERVCGSADKTPHVNLEVICAFVCVTSLAGEILDRTN